MERRYRAWYESKQLDGTETAAQAMEKAGLNWTVEKRRLRYECLDGTTNPIENRVALVRSDNEMPLAVTGDGYEPCQNRLSFSWFDPLIEQGMAKFVSAGSFKGGRKIWALAELTNPITLPGDDTIRKCILLLNGHDGGTAITVQPTPLRFVCSNTVNASLSRGGVFKLHHIQGHRLRMDQLQRFIFGMEKEFETVGETFKRLLAAPINYAELDEFTRRLLPVSAEKDGRVREKIEGERRVILDLAETGRGTEIPGVRGSRWGAYNAAVEYADFYAQPKTRDRGFSTVAGGIRRFKQRALELLEVG